MAAGAPRSLVSRTRTVAPGTAARPMDQARRSQRVDQRAPPHGSRRAP